MNVLWQDNAPLFLDASNPDAGGFTPSGGDVGTPWFASADGDLLSGQSVLWWENGADSVPAASGLTGFTGFDPGSAAGGWLPNGAEAFSAANPTIEGGLLWPDGGSTSSWLPTNAGAGQFNLSAFDPASSQWLQAIGEFAGHPKTWLTEVSSLLWTGGSGEPPLTPPVIPDFLHLTGSLAAPTLSTLSAEHVVWTDPSAATGLLAGPGLGDVHAAVMSGVGATGQPTGGLPMFGVGERQ
jgi:hypothetical protein